MVRHKIQNLPQAKLPERLAHALEGRSIAEFLSAQRLPAVEIADRIRRDPTISDEVRARAQQLAEPLP